VQGIDNKPAVATQISFLFNPPRRTIVAEPSSYRVVRAVEDRTEPNGKRIYQPLDGFLAGSGRR
jgi:hypothetical protein